MVDGNPSGFTAKAGEPVNINYTINTPASGNAGSASRSILALSKPAMMGAGLLALGTLGVGLFSMIKIPGLQNQIEDLTNEIDRLTVEIDVLSAENDRYEVLNQGLNETLQDLVALNDDLNATATQLEDSVDELNVTVTNLTYITQDLQAEADTLQDLNNQLTANQQDLRDGLVQLEASNITYTALNAELQNTSETLSVEVDQLQTTNDELTNTTQGLNASITTLQQQNEELGVLVADLTVINEYFTAWSVSTTDSLANVEAQLASNTQLYRSNTFLALNNYYKGLIQQWDCMDNVIWYDQEFYRNRTAPVFSTQNGPQNLAGLLSEVNDRMMTLMCLQLSDFEAFMQNNTGKSLAQVSYNDFNTAVGNYGNNAMDYYGLPVPGKPAVKVVTEQEWEDASFDCTLLTNPYRWQ